MKYTINAIRRTPILLKTGKTWNKTEVKTNEGGEKIYRLGSVLPKGIESTLKVGQSIDGYIETRTFQKKDGMGVEEVLNGIESSVLTSGVNTPAPSQAAGWDTGQASPGLAAPVSTPVPTDNTGADEIPW